GSYASRCTVRGHSMTETNPLELVITRTIDVSRAQVWKAWTVKEHIEQWWCPKPWRAEFVSFEMRPGGAFDMRMTGPEGEEQFIPASILDIVPKERIVFTDILRSAWRPVEKPFLGFAAIITMKDAGAGTSYTARVQHKTPEDAKKHGEMGFYDGWGTCITQLETFAKTL
ncbi:MAG: SRPBCC family protein, partial [Amphiplicatus sp.]